jgi:hypothetical protein
VIAAEQYASRLVVPTSQRSHPTAWASHKDHAAKALKTLAGPHLPASLKQLDRAIKRAHRDYETAAEKARQHATPERPAAPTANAGESQCNPPSDIDALGSIVDDKDAELNGENDPGL